MKISPKTAIKFNAQEFTKITFIYYFCNSRYFAENTYDTAGVLNANSSWHACYETSR